MQTFPQRQNILCSVPTTTEHFGAHPRDNRTFCGFPFYRPNPRTAERLSGRDVRTFPLSGLFRNGRTFDDRTFWSIRNVRTFLLPRRQNATTAERLRRRRTPRRQNVYVWPRRQNVCGLLRCEKAHDVRTFSNTHDGRTFQRFCAETALNCPQNVAPLWATRPKRSHVVGVSVKTF